VAALLGWSFFPWQCYVADVAGEYDKASKLPCYRTTGVGVARQNGKTTLVCVRIARQLIPPRQTVAYTAQDRGLARTKWGEHVDLLMSTAFADRVARIDRVNHRECLTMHNGSRYMPVTPSAKKAGRSLSIDLAVVDEAHAHDSLEVISAIQPAMAARAHAQIWLLSNAGNSRSHLWRHYTDVGRLEVENPASTMCWFEYAPSGEDIDQFDRSAWGEANPSLGLPGGVLETALSDGALTMDRDTFFREHLNVWMDSSTLAGIDAATWAGCRREDVAPDQTVALALDFTPERDHGTLIAAGQVEHNGETLTALEVVETSNDLPGLILRAINTALRWDAVIVLDRGSPAGSAIPFVEQSGARLELINQIDLVRACGDFFDAALSRHLSHRGDFRLTDAVVGANKRSIGDGWIWQRRGGVDISPLMAATLARWGAVAITDNQMAVW
jgi:phage terminase large subunit-like protein